MIFEIILKTGNILFIESSEDFIYFIEAKERKKNLILDEIELVDNTAKILGEVLVDVYSIETIRKIQNTKEEQK